MARKSLKAGSKPLDSASPMTSQERWEKHTPAILRAKKALERAQAEVKSASSEYRNKLKAFKSDGGNIDMLIFVMNDSKRDIDEVESDLRAYNEYASFIGMPLGTQLGMFGEDTPPPAPKGAKGAKAVKAKAKGGKAAATNGHATNGHAGKISTADADAARNVLKAKIGPGGSTRETIGKAREEGRLDGERGKTSRNVYSDGSPEALAYAGAYNTAQAAMVAKLGEGTGKPAH